MAFMRASSCLEEKSSCSAVAAEGELAGDAGLMDLDEGEGAGGADGADEGDGHLLGDIKGIDRAPFPPAGGGWKN